MRRRYSRWIAGIICLLLVVGELNFIQPANAYGAQPEAVSAITEDTNKDEKLPEDEQEVDDWETIPESENDLGEEQKNDEDNQGNPDELLDLDETDTEENLPVEGEGGDIPEIEIPDVKSVSPPAEQPQEIDTQDEVPELEETVSEEEIARQRAMKSPLVEQEVSDLDIEDAEPSLARANYWNPYYDARSESLITGVKNQNPWGTCWAFATTSIAETSLVKDRVKVNGTVSNLGNTDLSELHAAYFFGNRGADPLGNTTGDSNILYGDYLEMGNDLYSQAFSYANWSGAVPEAILPYTSAVRGKKFDSNLAYFHPAVLKNAYFINKSSTQIKQAVAQYGSVAISYYHDDGDFNAARTSYYNFTNHAYSYPKSGSVNHAVTIVGWDDNYAKTKFNAVSKVKNNGAWIVKNSWGKDWGKQGYFYISYEDQSIERAMAMEFQDGSTYDYNYQYDGTSGLSYGRVANNEKISNVFKVKGSKKGKNEILKAVNFALHDANIQYQVEVYVDLQNLNNPTSGTLALKTPVKKTTYEGIHTVDLGTSISLSKDTYYSVVVTLSGKNEIQYFVESSYGAIDQYGQRVMDFKASLAAKQSFVYSRGVWHDTYNYGFCARIKAFANEDSATPIASTIKKAESTGYNSLKVTWTKSAGAAGYEIYRSDKSNGSYKSVGSVNGNTVTYTDKSLSFNQTYYYKVRAYKMSTGQQVAVKVKGTYSSVVNGKTALKKTAISSAASAGYLKIKVSWGKITGANGYQIVRSTSQKGTYTHVAYVTNGETVSFTDSKNTTGKKYYYKVRGYRNVSKKKIFGGYSDIKWGISTVAKPKIASAKKVSSGKVKLTWKKVTGAMGYQIYRSTTGKAGSYKKIKTIKKGTSISYTNSKLKRGQYYYKVRAYRTVKGKAIYGPDSSAKSLKLN